MLNILVIYTNIILITILLSKSIIILYNSFTNILYIIHLHLIDNQWNVVDHFKDVVYIVVLYL